MPLRRGQLLAAPEDFITNLHDLNPKVTYRRPKAVKYYLNHLAMLLTGASLHCEPTVTWTKLSDCLQTYREGMGGHGTYGVSMAGMARMAET